MEFLTLGMVQLISDLLEKLGVGAVISEGMIWALVIVIYAIALFILILCLHIGHAKLMKILNRIKMKRGRGWIGNIKNTKRLSFEDQFDELFARS